MVGPGKIAVLYLAWFVNVAQSAAQKKVQCLCSPQDGFDQYQISPPMTDVVDEAKDHCTIAWTCNTKECAHYDYGLPEKDALEFHPPVMNASFDAVDVESHVVVLVTVDCPLKGFVAKDLTCLPCEKSSPSTPPMTTNQDPKSTARVAQRDLLLKTIPPLVLVALFGIGAVIFILKRCKNNPEPTGQEQQQQAHQEQEDQQEREAFL